ncbi:MAG: hypothetical protein FJ387_03520 [Verrucomicrobia bacterium]|nr:hypothetical protein [Verrucomicrobiota bacterium]
MSMRDSKQMVTALLLGVGSALSASPTAEPAAKPPNIVFILTDDQGYGDVGVFYQRARAAANVRSEPWHFTPSLDALASEGAMLRHHYCPAPVCAPSRASLLLGVHQGHANVRNNQFDKALEDNHTLASVLRQAGYATACIGKWGLQGSGTHPGAWPAYPTQRGFDYYFGYVRHTDGHGHYPKDEARHRGPKQVWEGASEVSAALDLCYTADLWTARAKQWILDQHRTNAAAPFFLFLAYDTPHAVLELPTQAYPTGGGVRGGLQWLGTPGRMINTATGTADSYYHPDYASQTWDHDGNPSTPEVAWADVYQRYATAVRRIDDAVGDLKLLLSDLNLHTNTLMIYTSDNGPSIESYLSEAYAANFFNSFGPFDGIKRDLWEGGVRMPTLAWWPGRIPAGIAHDTPSQFHDWLATFCEAAGLAPPARTDGVSLLPSLTGNGRQRAPTVYIEYYQNGTTPSYPEFLSAHRGRRRQEMQAIRLGDFVGVRYDAVSHGADFEIYNVVTDPQQALNLATSTAFAPLQQQMKQAVLRLRRPDLTAPRPYDRELVPATQPHPVTPGVEWRSYTGSYPWVPEWSSVTPAASGETDAVTLAVRPRDREFGLLFTGYLAAPVDGDYTFYLSANLGALLRVHEATVIDADFGYVAGTERRGSIRLQAGLHPYRLYFLQGTNGSAALEWSWSGPGFPQQPLPLSALYRPGLMPPGPPRARDDTASTSQGTPVTIAVLANDLDDGTPQPLRLEGATPPKAGLVETGETTVRYTPAEGFLGRDRFTYTATDGSASATGQVSVLVYFADSELLWFPFNQTSGSTVDESGGRSLGVLTGFSDVPSPWVAGRFGRALEFNGASSYVAVDTAWLPPARTSARTTAAWIKVPTGGGTGAIVAWGPNTTSRKWMMRLDNAAPNTGALRVEVGSGYAIAPRDLRDGQWHHVAGVLPSVRVPNATDILLYVDGIRQENLVTAASPVDTDAVPATIGLDAQNRYFAGAIDEVRIYHRALSDLEVHALVADPSQSAAAWHRRYFGNAALAWGEDADGDGVPALGEYAFGGEPHLPGQMTLPRPSLASGHFEVEFLRRSAGTHELVYAVDSSIDLAGWSAAGIALVSATPVPEQDGFERVRLRALAPLSAASSQFVRVAVGLP